MVRFHDWTAMSLMEVMSPVSNDTSPIEGILLAASLPDTEILARVAGIGPNVVAEVMLAEVACRAALLDGPADRVVIQCDLSFGSERLGYLLVLGNGGAYVEKGWDAKVPATLRQGLVDMLREIFGPPGPSGATRELLNKAGEAAALKKPGAAAVVVGLRQVVAALSQGPNSLFPISRSGSAQTSGASTGTHRALREVLRAVP